MSKAILLPQAIKYWGTPQFKQQLKQALLNLSTNDLPLHQATEQGGFVVANKLNFSVQTSQKQQHIISVKLFVFFYELVIGCGCGDEPFETPVTCEMQCNINCQNAQASFTIL